MISVEDFGKSVKITGHPEQVAMEFELVARVVRGDFCKYMGKELGNAFFEYILANAKKTEAELEEEFELIKKENPEFVEEFERSSVIQDLNECFGKA